MAVANQLVNQTASQTPKLAIGKHSHRKFLDRFDNIPLICLPFVLMQWVVCFLTYMLGHFIVHHTSKIEVEGRENLVGGQNYIFCGWHENLYPYFNSHRGFDRPIVGFIDTNWHVMPILWFVSLFGCLPLYKRREGTSAALVERMIRLLKDKKYSQLIFPDGPVGPAKKLHSGALVTAQRSGVPIVPFRMETQGEFRVFWQWDKKKVSLPFGRMKIVYGKPVHVTRENWREVKDYLIQNMG